MPARQEQLGQGQRAQQLVLQIQREQVVQLGRQVLLERWVPRPEQPQERWVELQLLRGQLQAVRELKRRVPEPRRLQE